MSDDLISQIEAAQAPARKKKSKASPGWYPNAARPGMESWWDGATWTGHNRAMPPGGSDEPDRTPPGKGWWDDPQQPNKKAYWDGERWVSGGTESSGGALVAAGYVTALFIPIVGFVIGIVLLARSQTGHGVAILLLSLLVFFVGFTVLLGL